MITKATPLLQTFFIQTGEHPNPDSIYIYICHFLFVGLFVCKSSRQMDSKTTRARDLKIGTQKLQILEMVIG